MNIKAIITRIEQRLAELNLSPRAASIKAGLSADAIRNWQRRAASNQEGASLTASSLEAIARALGVDAAWLMDGRDDTGSARKPTGFSEDATPFQGKVDGAADPIKGLYAAQARHASITHRALGDLPAFGICAGDLIVCDLSRLPQPGEVAVAVAIDTNTGTSQTMIRRYSPPYLLSGDGLRLETVEIATSGLDIRFAVVGIIRGT